LESYKELYEQLIEQEETDTLKVIEYDTCPSDKSAFLNKFNIDFDIIYRFENLTKEESKQQSESSRSDFGGCTFYYSEQQTSKAVIVIQKLFSEDSENYNYLWKYLSLIHELGHVKDFKIKKFINCDTLKTDHFNSEVYAETHVLNTFKKCSDDLSVLARSQYCKRLLHWNNSQEDFKFNISQAVINKFSRKKIEKWSKA
jgi:hypothetical protein